MAHRDYGADQKCVRYAVSILCQHGDKVVQPLVQKLDKQQVFRSERAKC